MASKKIGKYLGEGFLIVFSVLFALFINNLAQNYQTKKKKELALSGIKKELDRNRDILQIWKAKHAAISTNLQRVIKGQNDALKDSLLQYDYLEFGILTGMESLIDSVLTDTAWESAKATGIVTEFSFDTTQKLTNVYTLQDNLMSGTLNGILTLYFSKDTHRMEELMATLNQFNLRFMELVGQENYMEKLYDHALKDLE